MGNLIPLAVDYVDLHGGLTRDEFGALERLPTWIDMLNEAWDDGRLPHSFAVVPGPEPPSARRRRRRSP